MAWMNGIDQMTVYLSTLTIGELRYGIASLSDHAKRAELERWLTTEVLRDFRGRILSLDLDVADCWGNLRARGKTRGRMLSPIDGMIAATALQKNLIVITRNESDFADTGVSLINPWKKA
jgi:predicted nucleic acid-binding protein